MNESFKIRAYPYFKTVRTHLVTGSLAGVEQGEPRRNNRELLAIALSYIFDGHFRCRCCCPCMNF